MKAILVVDIPDIYNDRDIYVLHGLYTFEGNRYDPIVEYKKRLSKVKLIPEKKLIDIDKDGYMPLKQYGDYVRNKLIDEILGEEE